MNATQNTPLEWSPLWDAMKAAPNAWILTTESMYYEMLGCLPPAAMSGDAFLVGEANRHNIYGYPVFACFAKNPKGIFATYMTHGEFNLKTRPFIG
jgi:hypothetical protein